MAMVALAAIGIVVVFVIEPCGFRSSSLPKEISRIRRKDWL